MSAENQESNEYPVEEIRIRPKESRLVIDVEGGLSFSLRLTPEGLMASLRLNQAPSQRAAVLKDDVVPATEVDPAVFSTPEAAPSAPAPLSPPAEAPEEWGKGEQRQFIGRLKSKPKDGRPDNKGLPTAWARLAAHQDANEEALMLSASFHKATRRIALGLNHNDQVTVRGYYYKSDDPQRMDSLRVFMFINYPGKPTRQEN
jgi:hypothetical protein